MISTWLMIIIYTCFDWMTGHKHNLGQLRSRAASQRWDWLHPSPYPACANLCHSIEWEYNQQVYAYKWLYHNLFNVIVIYSLGHCPPAYRVYNPIWLHDPCFTCHLSFQHTSIPIFFMRRAPASSNQNPWFSTSSTGYKWGACENCTT